MSQPGGVIWWETRRFAVAMVLLAFVPLLYPPIPPLVDLLGHMGRYRVMLAGPDSPLHQWYHFRWAIIGNLGVDLLVYPLGKAIGLEPAVKLIVMSIPPLTVAGFLWVAREVHGRLTPTAAFALPFAYAYPFNYGFVNFALSMALCFLAFGLWLRLERFGKYRLRSALFVPISCVVWISHTFGWGVLGLLAFSAEVIHRHDRTGSWPRAMRQAVVQVLPLTVPLLFMVVWRSETGSGMTGDWFGLASKLISLVSVLRDRWQPFDILSMAVALFIFGCGLIRSSAFRLSRNLAVSLLLLVAIFLLLPRIIFGSAYADMRLAPFIFAVALLAVRPKENAEYKVLSFFAAAGVAFYLLRIAGNTLSFSIAASEQQSALAALNHVPRGARVATLVQQKCDWPWVMKRNDHLGTIVIVRREGFSNDQWDIEDANLMDVRYPAAGEFQADPSQQIRGTCARQGWSSVGEALGRLPFSAFDYLWLVDVDQSKLPAVRQSQLIWRGRNSLLYRMIPPNAAVKEPWVDRSTPVDRRSLLQ